MKFMKKMGFLVLAAALIFAFTACGSTDTSEEATDETTVSAEFDLAAGIARTDNDETGESTVESDIFKVTLPNGASWDYEVVSPEEIDFYNIAAKDADLGGRLFTLQAFEPDDESYDPMPNAVVGEKDGKKIVAVFTSDVEYDIENEDAAKEYMEVYEVVQKISDDASTSPLILK